MRVHDQGHTAYFDVRCVFFYRATQQFGITAALYARMPLSRSLSLPPLGGYLPGEKGQQSRPTWRPPRPRVIAENPSPRLNRSSSSRILESCCLQQALAHPSTTTKKSAGSCSPLLLSCPIRSREPPSHTIAHLTTHKTGAAGVVHMEPRKVGM